MKWHHCPVRRKSDANGRLPRDVPRANVATRARDQEIQHLTIY